MLSSGEPRAVCGVPRGGGVPTRSSVSPIVGSEREYDARMLSGTSHSHTCVARKCGH